ncbi:MAG: hypothetical protein AAB150_15110 [Pseudomonadota bacterium]
MSASTRKRDSVGFAVFLALCLAVSAIGGAATASSVGAIAPQLI